MTDIVAPAVRSRMMSAVRGADTIPEVLLRSGLHRLGFRFRLHGRDLPGRPDIVLPKWRAVVFLHGCFWHGHPCPLFRWPATRREFWRRKINRNREVDARAVGLLQESGWRVLVVYECAMRQGRSYQPVVAVLEAARWIRSRSRYRELEELGRSRRPTTRSGRDNTRPR